MTFNDMDMIYGNGNILSKEGEYYFLVGYHDPDKRDDIYWANSMEMLKKGREKIYNLKAGEWNHITSYFEYDKNPPRRCRKCQSAYVISISEHCEEYKIMKSLGYCFTCAFWQKYVNIELYSNMDPKNRAIINGEHFIIDKEETKGFRGFGGAEFKIKFDDGREIVTHNLWTQGQIPKRFRDKLKDNAVFVR